MGGTPTYKRESLRHTKEVGTITIQEGCASDLQGGGGGATSIQEGGAPDIQGGATAIQEGEPQTYKGGSHHTEGGASVTQGGRHHHSRAGPSDVQNGGGGHHHTREGHLRHTISRGFPIIYEGSSQTYKGGGGAITVQEGEHQT